jgi:hypothetical protein
MVTGEGKREKGEGRREKGEGRREKGEGRREKGEGRREKGEGRREKGEGEGERHTRMQGIGRNSKRRQMLVHGPLVVFFLDFLPFRNFLK